MALAMLSRGMANSLATVECLTDGTKSWNAAAPKNRATYRLLEEVRQRETIEPGYTWISRNRITNRSQLSGNLARKSYC
jgi:hypothetical protein